MNIKLFLSLIPHYIGVSKGHGIGYIGYLLRGSPQKIGARMTRRAIRRRANNQ